MNLNYGSVCSGIEAASVAWEPLGFNPSWFAEIEAFPSAVLAAHWPEIKNLGDMTKIAEMVKHNEVEAPVILVGGTPCQAFSVAGARKGIADPRGMLTIKYGELADEIDNKRAERNEQPAIIVWENVPGVLSSKDNAFGCFLGMLAGESCDLVAPGGKWSNAGYVSGPKRAIAWRVLDAQYFGVAQRRRRVFVVASARDNFDPARILFEFEGMRRDSAPRREAREVTSSTAGRGFKIGSHWDNPANAHPTINQSHNIGGIGQSNQELFSQRGAGIVSAFRMVAFGEYSNDETASTCKARDYKDATDLAVTSPIAVRRLTPIECERLQGFPDGHTLVKYRGKQAANGHRYKALGNSMAVPCMAWIGKRILWELTK